MNPDVQKMISSAQRAPYSDRSRHFGLPKYTNVLREKLVLIFCLAALAVISVQIKYIFEINQEISEIRSAVTSVSEVRPDMTARRIMLEDFKDKLITLLGISILAFGLLIFLLVQRVIRPLQILTVTAKEISHGNLNVTVTVQHKYPMAELGGLLNEVAANLQEVLLLTFTTVGNSRCSLESMERVLELDSNSSINKEVLEQVSRIHKNLDTLSSIAKDFEFYQTHFDGQKVVAKGPQDK
jgi:methyl-accepting chemotaxis protein